MSAPVTEAHKRLVATIVERAFRFAEKNHKITPELSQLIADSEARATDQLRQQVANLTHSNDSHRETAETWRAAAIERAQLRAEVKRLTAKIANQADRIRCLEGATNHATGTPLSQAIARAERAEREVADLKANNRFQRGHSAGYAEAKADCEAELATERKAKRDLAQAELATERTRLRKAARAAAWSAARDAARDAARAAARAAELSAARSAQADQLRKMIPNPFEQGGTK